MNETPANRSHQDGSFRAGSDLVDIGLPLALQIPDRRLAWWMLTGLMLVVSLGMLSIVLVLSQFQDSTLQSRAVVHGHQVLDELSAALDLQQQAMSDLRTYVNGGSRDSLLIFQRAQQKLPGHFEQLRSMVTTDADKQLVDTLQQLSDENFLFSGQVLTEYLSAGENSSRLSVMMRSNGMSLRKFRQFVVGWREREESALLKSVTLAEQRLVAARRYSLGSLLVAVGLVLLLGTLLLRHLRHRAQTQRRLQLTSTIWNGTLESLAQGVGLYSMDDHLLLWNRRFAEIQGIDVDKLYQGIPAEEVFKLSMRLADRDAATEMSDMLSAAELVRTQGGQYLECMRMDGMVVQSAALPMTEHYYVVTLNDVTAMRESEWLARDQAIRLAAIMDNAPDAIITVNAEGLIESWNAGAQRIFGYTSDEVMQRGFATLMAEPYASAHKDYLYRLHQENSGLLGKRLELMARHRDQREFHVDLVVSEMRIDTRPLFVGIVRDLTDYYAVERLKREFVATVTHELRTPLTSIAGSLGLMLAGAGGELPAKAQHLLSIAHKNSERLAILINDILDLERIEADGIDLTLQPDDLRNVVQQSIEVNRIYAQVRRIEFEFQSTHEPLRVMLDEKRIMQVMANLLSNAAKFSPADATVLIKLERRDGQARVSVHDEGPGIPAEFHERIFTRFAQADASDSRLRGGSGLGLAISKSLIERHCGRMSFTTGQSAVGSGGGATFWFDLPLNSARPFTAPVVSSLQIPVAAAGMQLLPCVLLVESDESISATLRVLLQDAVTIVVANNIAQAREWLSVQRFALIILELELPDGHGSELLSELQQQSSVTPVILYSACEPSREVSVMVHAALLKSRDSMNELKAVALRALQRH